MTTLGYMFWGYAAAFLLVGAYVGRLSLRLRDLERRSRRLEADLRSDDQD